MPKLPFRRLVR